MSVIIGVIVSSLCFYLYSGVTGFTIYLLNQWGVHPIISFVSGLTLFGVFNYFFDNKAHAYYLEGNSLLLSVLNLKIISLNINDIKSVSISKFSFGIQKKYITRVGIGLSRVVIEMKKGNMYSLPIANIRKFDLLTKE